MELVSSRLVSSLRLDLENQFSARLIGAQPILLLLNYILFLLALGAPKLTFKALDHKILNLLIEIASPLISAKS